MAERYQDRHFPSGDDYDRAGGPNASAKPEGDPLAELARLIGQTDPFGTIGRANLPLQPHAKPVARNASYDSYEADNYRADNYEADSYEAPAEPDDAPPPSPPSWIQRAVRQEAPPPPLQDDYPSSVHPLHRYATEHPPVDDNYDPAHLFADAPQEPDLSRYDDALYGGFDSDAQNAQQAYGEDSYAYDEEQNFEAEQEPRRRGGMITVVAVLALAVFGVGGAFAYRTYTGSARSGEPPIIRADAGPTKIIPAPTDNGTKVPDRMATGDGMEKIVSREETPIDPNARNLPRVVWPPLNQNGGPPPAAGAALSAPPPASSGNGTLSNSEPRKVKTFSVHGDQADAATPAAGAPAPAAKPAPRIAATPAQRPPVAAANPNAANANAPLSLSPQGAAAPAAADPPVRVAATNPNPVQNAPSTPSAGAASGNYLVQVSSQRSEADAQASYRALQNKYPSVLGSQSVVVKRVDLGEKGVYYRAFAGPFNSSDQATQVCSSLKAAGGPQCLIQRN
jgi:cell division protein FtsN